MQHIFGFIYRQNLTLLFIVMLIILFIFGILFSYCLNKHKKIICSLFFIFALLLVVCETLILRSFYVYEIELRPFYTFVMARKQVEYYRTFFMNALLFVPLGLAMPYCLSKKPYKRNVFITIGFACVLSAVIEFLQYYYHLGRCETDDVIANTLGAAIGTLSYCLYMKILKNQEKGSLMQKINYNQKLLLDLCAKSLFDKDVTITDELDSKALIEEAKKQTVFPVAYSLIKDKCDDVDGKVFSQIIAKNIRVEYGHNEVHKVLSKNNIPYVVLKGVASSQYYPEPTLRTMGDIDILVLPDDILKADNALKSIGFVTKDSIDKEGHIAYSRRDGLVCELHRQINGIPKNDAGRCINEYFANIFEKSQHITNSNYECIVPDKFHHGIILLLHTATHLTREGVGLRHLCDWAVFVNAFSLVKFENMFKIPLKEMGLWNFAVLLTQCCEKFLECSKKYLTPESNHDLINGVMIDVLNGGNFGYKDVLRYNQIKYINDRKSGNVSKKSPILQLLASINQKTKNEFKFTTKFKFLLPFGWILTIFKYIYLVIIGKRTADNLQIISDANRRKNIYNDLRLFEKD